MANKTKKPMTDAEQKAEAVAEWDNESGAPAPGARTTTKRLKRPRDPVQLGKLIGDILTGQVEDRAPTPEEQGKNPHAVQAVPQDGSGTV